MTASWNVTLRQGDDGMFQGIYETLLKKVKELMISDPSAQQAVAVLTSKGCLLSFVNHDIISGQYEEETAFINTLVESGETEIQYLLCMWSDFTLDVPSHHLWDLLVKRNPINGNARIFLKGDGEVIVKTLDVLKHNRFLKV